MHMPARPLCQPVADQRRLGGCVIVHDEVDVQIFGNSGFDLIEKFAELSGAMASVAFANDPAGCDVEGGGQRLCLPQIKPEHIGDAVHPGSDSTEYVPLPRRHVISARPCSTISECACHYRSPCRTAAHGADGVRRIPRYDRSIPCGSSRSTVLRMRFARVNAETSGGLECRSIERGG